MVCCQGRLWRFRFGGCCGSGFGLRVSGFGFRVSGFGFRVSGFGFRVSGFGSRVSDSGFRVSSFGFRVSGLGFRVSDFEIRVLGSRVSGFVCRVRDGPRGRCARLWRASRPHAPLAVAPPPAFGTERLVFRQPTGPHTLYHRDNLVDRPRTMGV